jgi:AcrR family transcriptional regulator
MILEKTAKGKMTRDEILTAAYKLFAEQGYHGTSMRQIAEESEIALGGIYNHFSGKEDIFKSLIIETHPISEVVPKLNSIQGSSVPDTVHYAAQTIQSTLSARGDYINLLFAELIEFKGEHINAIFSEVFPRAVDTARMLLGDKELRSRNIPLMFMLFLAMMFGFFIVNRFISQRLVGKFIQLDLEEVVNIFLYGILPDQEEGRS